MLNNYLIRGKLLGGEDVIAARPRTTGDLSLTIETEERKGNSGLGRISGRHMLMSLQTQI